MRNIKISFLLIPVLLLSGIIVFAQTGKTKVLLDKGWAELVKDNDIDALRYFGQAYEAASLQNNTSGKAISLLNMGICSYGSSISEGLDYCLRSMEEYKLLEDTDPEVARLGRSKCLQLLATIYGRQGKYRDAIHLMQEALPAFQGKLSPDNVSYPGLIYHSLGACYAKLSMKDSSEYYYKLALRQRRLNNEFVYLPVSYLAIADIDLTKGDKIQSKINYEEAVRIADSTGNRQAQVSALIGLGRWYHIFEKNESLTKTFYNKAKKIASSLSDKTFYLKVINQLVDFEKSQGNFKDAQALQEELTVLKDSMNVWETQRIVKKLEVQFEVSEIDRKLNLVSEEKDIATITNYILWSSILVLVLISLVIIVLLRRINKRDKVLLQTKEALVKLVEEQKALKEQQMQNELEYKESQLSAMTLQMLQKNELMQELKARFDNNSEKKDDGILKIINKGLNQDKDWSDFETHFESINKNFYTRLRQVYPGISVNDLKICALIKLNLSIKEMAAILNISPDSVKTARYRLRKKLGLNTEDNLTDFILSL